MRFGQTFYLLLLLGIGLAPGCNQAKRIEKTSVPTSRPTLEIDLDNVVATIDGLTYGSNQKLIPEVRLRRIGGNRMTGYNWEINSSNSGNDGNHTSYRWLNSLVGMDPTDSRPAAWILKNLELHKSDNADSVVTIPLAGYVVADGNDTFVSPDETAPSKRWVQVQAAKPGSNFGSPDLHDGKVFVDEKVAWLVSKAGTADKGGPAYYSLDNEPSLWSRTHARLHPGKTAYNELSSKSIAAAKAILDVDPAAKIIGPALYGWYGHASLQDAPDNKAINKSYGNFSAYFLSQMRIASENKGKRLLHIFDFHWYPEAQGGGTRISGLEGGSLTTDEIVQARLQAPRSLWDSGYVEDSWIAKSNGKQPIQLIPRMQKIIKDNYPGTRLGILEYNYGGGHHVSGGLATADALGIFGRFGVASCLWAEQEDNQFEKAAFRLFLNYHGQGSSFQENALDVPQLKPELESIYASRSEDSKSVTVVLINKQPKNILKKQILIKGVQESGKLRSFRFGPEQPEILPVSEKELRSVKGGFEIECPPQTATLVEVQF